MSLQQGHHHEADRRSAELQNSGTTIEQIPAKTKSPRARASESPGRSDTPHPNLPWDAEQDRVAAELYLSGLSQDQVAGRVGSNQSMVRRSLKRSGIKSRKLAWDADRDRRVAELYLSGLNQDEVAERVGSSQGKVCASLERSGIKSHRLAWDPARDLRVVELYLSGLSSGEVAVLVLSTDRHVTASLRRTGVQVRPRGAPGARNGSWKGGRHVDADGYVLVHTPGHPHVRKGTSYVLEHRLVMEQILGRFLEPEEVVHHKGEKSDNRAEKLLLFPSNAEHLAVELLGRQPKWTEEGLRSLAKVWMDPDRKPGKPSVPHGTGARTVRRKAIQSMKSDPNSTWDQGPVADLPEFPTGKKGPKPGPKAAGSR